MYIDDPRFAFLRDRPAAEQLAVLTIARAVQRRSPLLHARLTQVIRYLGLRPDAVRFTVLELEDAGLVRVVPPGRNRRGFLYKWTGGPEPVIVPPFMLATAAEAAILRVLEEAAPGWIRHAALLRRVSPGGVRARDLWNFVAQGRRYGILEVAPTARGYGRMYRLVGAAEPAAAAG